MSYSEEFVIARALAAQRAERERRERTEEQRAAESKHLNERARSARLAGLERARAEAQGRREEEDAERRAAEETTVRAVLKASFFAANPSASAADFERAYPDLKAAYYRQQQERVMASMRDQYGGMI
jgi:hypothetical protein